MAGGGASAGQPRQPVAVPPSGGALPEPFRAGAPTILIFEPSGTVISVVVPSRVVILIMMPHSTASAVNPPIANQVLPEFRRPGRTPKGLTEGPPVVPDNEAAESVAVDCDNASSVSATDSADAGRCVRSL